LFLQSPDPRFHNHRALIYRSLWSGPTDPRRWPGSEVEGTVPLAKSASGVAAMLRPSRGYALEGNDATSANLIQ